MKDEEKDEGRTKGLKAMLSSIEDELNVHHYEYCEHATYADLVLSFQIRKLLACVELLHHFEHVKQTDFADPEAIEQETSKRSFAFNK